MLKRVHIRDFAIIADLEFPLRPGLTVITGETGSGKSIIVQAMSVALGTKPSKTMVRGSRSRAVVEVDHNRGRDSVNFQRVITRNQRVRNFIDDIPHSLAKFTDRSIRVADFHGQHEQQYIMNPATHIDFLDSYCGLTGKVAKLENIYRNLDTVTRQLADQRSQLARSRERLELLEFQLREIETVAPKADEDTLLHEEYQTLSHRDELVTAAARLEQVLSGEESALLQALTRSIRDLERLQKYDQRIESPLQALQTAVINLEDANYGLQDHIRALDHNPERLKELEERIQALEGLKRKYGGSLASVMEAKDAIQREIDQLSGLDTSIHTHQRDLEALTAEYGKLASALHAARLQGIPELARGIATEMQKLKMPAAVFEVRLTVITAAGSSLQHDGQPVQITPKGFDGVEFYLSVNPGENPKPLTQIASGGEISRIMLAIKTILQANDPVDTLIFDEIDAGISGVAAELVARNLYNLARTKQVICVTHLPQIAAIADHHLQVVKTQTSSETHIQATYLEQDQRIRAVAELFGGKKLTGADLSAAQAMYAKYHG